MMRPLINIISHTDLDGVVAAAVAWHALYPDNSPLQIYLIGYGDVDNVIFDSVSREEALSLVYSAEGDDRFNRQFSTEGSQYV